MSVTDHSLFGIKKFKIDNIHSLAYLSLTHTHTHMTAVRRKLMQPKFYLCPHSQCFLLSGCRPSEAHSQQKTAGSRAWLKCRPPESKLLAVSCTAATFYLSSKYQALCLLSYKSARTRFFYSSWVCVPFSSLGAFQQCINQYDSELSLAFLSVQSASPQRLLPGHLTGSAASLSLFQLYEGRSFGREDEVGQGEMRHFYLRHLFLLILCCQFQCEFLLLHYLLECQIIVMEARY